MILVEWEGKMILARLGVTVLLVRVWVENHSLTCWSPLGWWTMRGQGLTLLTTSANFRILLLSVPRFLPAARTKIRNLK